MTTPHQEAKQIAQAFFKEVADACGRVVNMNGDAPAISVKPTSYVIDGRTITLKTDSGEFPFWLGLNSHRIFFIVFMNDLDVAAARDFYKYTFGGAHKMGWDVNIEPLSGGVSIWNTYTCDPDKPLATTNGTEEGDITKEGLFWATDIAMMVQSWVRTSERGNLSRHPLDPAPL